MVTAKLFASTVGFREGIKSPICATLFFGTAKSSTRKVRDERSFVSCLSGRGLVREEVWEDAAGNVIRYNLTFINHFLTKSAQGRVLGYDNAHGFHHRHFMGVVESYNFKSYSATFERFIQEVDALRKEKT